jgi:zinc protease
MILRRIIFVFLFLTLPLSARAQDKVFNAETFTLRNGMEVVVIPNHRAPVVTHMVWFRAGAADEPQGYSGIAHFLEHLKFKGTEKLAPGEFSKTVKKLGGNDNAFTSQDYTAYYQTISKEHLGTVMEMEADRMVNLAPPPEEVASEHKVIIEERRQRTENDPQAMFGEQMRSSLFVNHPYGTPVIGWMHEMQRLNWPIAKEFHRKWYSPSNAILVISADITAEELRPMAEKIYGAIQPVEVPKRERTSVPELKGERRIIYRHKDIRQPYFERLILAPGYRQNPQESLALQVMEEAISGGPTTRLYRTLAVEQKVATGAGMYYRSDAWDSGEVGLYATPVEGIPLEQLEQAFEEELRLVVSDGVSEEELRQAKKRLKAKAIYARDSLSGPAMVMGRALTTGSVLEDVEQWPAKIDAVTLQQVNEVAKKYLDPDKGSPYVTGYLLPGEEEIKQ